MYDAWIKEAVIIKYPIDWARPNENIKIYKSKKEMKQEMVGGTRVGRNSLLATMAVFYSSDSCFSTSTC